MSKTVKLSDDSYKKIWQIAKSEGCFLSRVLDKAIYNYFKSKLPKNNHKD